MKKIILILSFILLVGCSSKTPEEFVTKNSMQLISEKTAEQLNIKRSYLEGSTLVINMELPRNEKNLTESLDYFMLLCKNNLEEYSKEDELFSQVKTFKIKGYFGFLNKKNYKDKEYRSVLEFKISREKIKGVAVMSIPTQEFINNKIYDIKGDIDVKMVIENLKMK